MLRVVCVRRQNAKNQANQHTYEFIINNNIIFSSSSSSLRSSAGLVRILNTINIIISSIAIPLQKIKMAYIDKKYFIYYYE